MSINIEDEIKRIFIGKHTDWDEVKKIYDNLV
jgi:hypothetical protein